MTSMAIFGTTCFAVGAAITAAIFGFISSRGMRGNRKIIAGLRDENKDVKLKNQSLRSALDTAEARIRAFASGRRWAA